jgi:hypothetical protein
MAGAKHSRTIEKSGIFREEWGARKKFHSLLNNEMRETHEIN